MPEVLQLLLDRIDTPIGELLLAADEAGNLRAIDWADMYWADDQWRMLRFLRLHYGERYQLRPARDPHGLSEVMRRYFAGEVETIDHIPVQTAGTPFQRSVWKELRRIPGGRTVSYGKLAENLSRPLAVRAVGTANGSNPIGIVVPCHRVIGADGSLTGYGGGLPRKRWLLEHERKHANPIASEGSLTSLRSEGVAYKL